MISSRRKKSRVEDLDPKEVNERQEEVLKGEVEAIKEVLPDSLEDHELPLIPRFVLMFNVNVGEKNT
jgi:hypothetical protein